MLFLETKNYLILPSIKQFFRCLDNFFYLSNIAVMFGVMEGPNPKRYRMEWLDDAIEWFDFALIAVFLRSSAGRNWLAIVAAVVYTQRACGLHGLPEPEPLKHT